MAEYFFKINGKNVVQKIICGIKLLIESLLIRSRYLHAGSYCVQNFVIVFNTRQTGRHLRKHHGAVKMTSTARLVLSSTIHGNYTI